MTPAETPEAAQVTVRFVAEGRVQGMGYRLAAAQAARRLAVTGCVRNCYEGTVEGVCSGAPEAVQAFLDWCRRGPPHAHVTRLESRPVESARGDAEPGLRILPDAPGGAAF